MSSPGTLERANDLYASMNTSCAGSRPADVVYALGMMFAQAVRDNEVDQDEAFTLLREVIELELLLDRSRR